jgi:integrase/recombinase XerD
MTDILASFLEDMHSRNLSKDTIRTYGWILQDFAKLMKGRGVTLEAVKRHDLKAYLDCLNQKCISHKTASLRFGALASFYDYLVFEEIIEANPVTAVQKRYLQAYKTPAGHTHQLISIEQAAALVKDMTDIRDKALLILLLKTGMRRKELIALDADDIDWQNRSIKLKPAAKRTNRIVFFDDEAEDYLRRWLRLREHRNKKKSPALFVTYRGRISMTAVNNALLKPALRLGIHDIKSHDMEHHFSAHCCRHFLVTALLRSGMKREYVRWIRGDAIRDAMDIYYHIDPEDVKKSYLAHVPLLGI